LGAVEELIVEEAKARKKGRRGDVCLGRVPWPRVANQCQWGVRGPTDFRILWDFGPSLQFRPRSLPVSAHPLSRFLPVSSLHAERAERRIRRIRVEPLFAHTSHVRGWRVGANRSRHAGRDAEQCHGASTAREHPKHVTTGALQAGFNDNNFKTHIMHGAMVEHVQMAIDRLIDKLPRNLPPLCKYFLSDSCRIANCRNLHRYHDLRALCRCADAIFSRLLDLLFAIATLSVLIIAVLLVSDCAISDSGCAAFARAATSVSICTRLTNFGKICPSTKSGSSRPRPIPLWSHTIVQIRRRSRLRSPSHSTVLE
jgi:hypothetical protein